MISVISLSVAIVAAFLPSLQAKPLRRHQTTQQALAEPIERSATQRLPEGAAPVCVFFLDDAHGWAVGYTGTILATGDGGASWNSQMKVPVEGRDEKGNRRLTAGISRELSSVYFIDAHHGWAVGTYGTILATSDGGANWKEQNSAFDLAKHGIDDFISLLSVHFADPSHGWAVGTYGTILATSDRGVTWMPQTSGTWEDLYSTYFPDAIHGWVVGGKGTILATSDGGTTWKPQSSGTTYTLTSVHFADTSHGWVVGKLGTILVTVDGGLTWKPQILRTSASLESVHFIDANRGWAAGQRGTILATSDGGSNWKPQNSGTSEDLRSVYFANARHGWAVVDYWSLGEHELEEPGSEGGMILTTTDGGATWELQAIARRVR